MSAPVPNQPTLVTKDDSSFTVAWTMPDVVATVTLTDPQDSASFTDFDDITLAADVDGTVDEIVYEFEEN